MNAFDAWERRIEGSPTWDDVDDLMGAIFSAMNPESLLASSMSVFGANRIWSGWEDLLNWPKMTRGDATRCQDGSSIVLTEGRQRDSLQFPQTWSFRGTHATTRVHWARW